jgi:hypothetical protein
MASYQSLTELKNYTQEQLFPQLINVLKVNDEFVDMLIADALVTDRLTIKFNRTASEGTAAYVGCDDAVTVSAVSGNSYSYDLKTINKSFSVCLPGKDQGSTFVDPTQVEMNGALTAISKIIGSDAISGLYGSGQLSGLNEQVVSTVAAASASDLIPFLDEAYDATLSRENLAFIMNPAAARAVEKDLRAAAGGLTYGELSGTTRTVSAYRGIPIVRSANVGAGIGYLVDRSQFKLFFGQGEGAIGSIFNVADAGTMETRLRKLMHIYVNAQTVLFNTQGATKITGLV